MHGETDIQVHPVDAHHERAVQVVNHLVAAEVELHDHGEQQRHCGAAQEPRFQAAFQLEKAGVHLAGVDQVRKPVAQLPAARGGPVNQNRKDHQRQDITAQQVVERQIEQIKGERLSENGIVPGGGRRRQTTRAGEADDGPRIDGRSGDEIAQRQRSERGQAGIERVFAEACAGESQGAGVSDPEY